MDGLEVTRRIKAQWPEVKVVLLTMHLLHREEACAAGANAFLVKGRSAEELVSTIVHPTGRSV